MTHTSSFHHRHIDCGWEGEKKQIPLTGEAEASRGEKCCPRAWSRECPSCGRGLGPFPLIMPSPWAPYGQSAPVPRVLCGWKPPCTPSLLFVLFFFNEKKVFSNVYFIYFLFFSNVYLFLGQRETEHERGRGRERGRHRIRNRLQALSHQPRAQRGAGTCGP